MICHHSPSPNFTARRDGARPSLVVLHYTAMQCAPSAVSWLCNPESQVSAHYLISETGDVFQMVAEDQRAWHAGAGQWGAICDVNSHSIGIELANPGDCPFPLHQMMALERLLAGIMQRWDIAAHRVIGHSDMAPGRKIDPGRRFDWQALARSGLSVWPGCDLEHGPAGAADEQQFLRLIARFGYTAEPEPATLLASFRLRFRPWAQGPLDAVDLRLAHDLATRFPVDAEGASA